VTRERDDDEGDTLSEPPWHEHTPTVVGASVAALLALGILYFLISTVARQFNEPDQAPSYYVDPGSSSSSSRTSATTTTETITSTVPPVTTEINPGDTSSTSTTTTTTDTSPNTNLPTTHRSTPSSSSESGYSRRPRFNETRTFPRPGG
jgi:cytoskeletal protein RodZ